MEQNGVKLEVLNESAFNLVMDSTSQLPVIKIKQEFSISGSNLQMKHEDFPTQELKAHIKLEVPDLKFGIPGDDDDIYIKLEPLVSEELQIKSDIDEEDSTNATLIKLIELEHSYSVHNIDGDNLMMSSNFSRDTDVGVDPFKFCRTRVVRNCLKCSLCDYKCGQKSHLQRHIVTHTGEKPFTCGLCEYRCGLKSTLKQHMLTHTGEKPFTCDICNYKCGLKGTLKEHILTHSGEKPYECSICNYRCVRKNYLKQHILKHTGDKKFKCSVCDRRYKWRSNLYYHMKTHKREKFKKYT